MPCSSMQKSSQMEPSCGQGRDAMPDDEPSQEHNPASPPSPPHLPPVAVASGMLAQPLMDNIHDRRAHRPSTRLCRSSRYLKRLKLRQSTGGSSFIFIRFCASCRQPQVSQLNLSSASRVSVELQHRD